MELRDNQEAIQSLLRQRRRKFLEKSKGELPKRFVENRFHQEEYRNEFEVARIWNRLTKKLVEHIHQAADHTPELMAYSPRILRKDPKFISIIAKKRNWNDASEAAEELAVELAGYIDEVLQTKIEASEEAAKRRQEREQEYMQLMVEMLDRAEQEQMNSVEEDD